MSLAQGAGPEDDPLVTREELLYRRIYSDDPGWIVKDDITGEPLRPTSGAFKPDTDGLSSYREKILRERNLTAADVITTSCNWVISVPVASLRDIGLGVKPDPWPKDVPDPQHERNAAHTLITGLVEVGRNERRRRQVALAELESIRFVYP